MLSTLFRLLMPVLLAISIGLLVDRVTTPRYDGPESDHFDGKRFFDDEFERPSLGAVLRWQLDRAPSDWEARPLAAPPTVPPARHHDGMRVTMVNHATLLAQFAGHNVLTDPIWSGSAGPFGMLGPGRFRPPGVHFEDLPDIDAVVVSHNHYDHMDMATLERLAEDPHTRFVVPLGNAAYLASAGIDNIVEIDWWQAHELDDGLRITAVPVKHWSRRRAFDENRALWAGFVIEAEGQRLFFGGDTGAGPHFAEIRARLGPPDVALLPIGAYLPRWFMKAQHISPGEAVDAHRQLGARHGVAMHFGTFRLADDGQDEAAAALRAALQGASDAPFWIPDNGESRVFALQ